MVGEDLEEDEAAVVLHPLLHRRRALVQHRVIIPHRLSGTLQSQLRVLRLVAIGHKVTYSSIYKNIELMRAAVRKRSLH